MIKLFKRKKHSLKEKTHKHPLKKIVTKEEIEKRKQAIKKAAITGEVNKKKLPLEQRVYFLLKTINENKTVLNKELFTRSQRELKNDLKKALMQSIIENPEYTIKKIEPNFVKMLGFIEAEDLLKSNVNPYRLSKALGKNIGTFFDVFINKKDLTRQYWILWPDKIPEILGKNLIPFVKGMGKNKKEFISAFGANLTFFDYALDVEHLRSSFLETLSKEERSYYLKKLKFSRSLQSIRTTAFLSKYEQKQIVENLVRISRSIIKNDVQVLVALDKSGRYVGRMVKDAIFQKTGKSIPLYFINPQEIINARNPKTNKRIKNIFEKEHPYLSKQIKNKTLAIIDEITINGITLRKTKTFFNEYSPKKLLDYTLEGDFFREQKNTSWREHGIQHPFIEQKDSLLVKRKIITEDKNKKKHKKLRNKMSHMVDSAAKKR